jgi:YHS domain-containing protein
VTSLPPRFRFERALCIVLRIALAPLGAVAAEEREGEAICPVCRVREGTRAPEPVRAERVVEGVRYGFCSAACVAAFDDDPGIYLSAAVADSVHVQPLVDFQLSRAATAPT